MKLSAESVCSLVNFVLKTNIIGGWFVAAVEICSINGKLKDGGERIMIESWNFTMFKDSIDKLFRLQQDQMMRYPSF